MDEQDAEELIEVIGRRPGEGARAWRALLDYVQMGASRSLSGLCRRYQGGPSTTGAAKSAAPSAQGASRQEGEGGPEPAVAPPTMSRRVLERWSSRFDWGARAAAWDVRVEQRRVEKWLARAEEVNEKDWGDGETLRKAAMDGLKAITKEGLSLAAVANALVLASKLQRLATNEPTENTQLSGAALQSAIEHELARVGRGRATIAAEGAEADGQPGE